MQTTEVRPEPQFVGSSDEQQLADEVFRTMAIMGRFFARTAPIRVPLTSIAQFVAGRHPERSLEDWTSEIDRILSENSEVFAREQVDDAVIFVTTASGHRPDMPAADQRHMLAKRFQEPVPEPSRPAATERRARAVTEEVVPVEPEESRGPLPETGQPEVGVPFTEETEEPISEQPAPVAAQPEVVDPAAVSSEDLAQVIAAELRQDMSVANFGDLWMAEDKVARLSRGDLRRIKEYLLERNEPLTDETLMIDALGQRQTGADFELARFALNFRLSREHREYEFVGTSDQRLWSTTGLPAIGTVKRKASEIGTDYRFLLEESMALPAQDEAVVEHVLTFYEYQYGVLPFDSAFAALFPPPMLPDQRTAVLVFESPQTYENIFVELHYPTGSRGGYLAGLERFFAENLIPGALITIEPSENNGRYLIEYLPISGQDRKLLQFDEKKGRYVFRPTTYYCATQENMVLTENRLPKFANAAPLDERTRRRPEETLGAIFERIGEQEGAGTERRYMAIIDDLLAAANVERPMSAELIRRLVLSPEYPQFSVDPDVEDVFYYQPITAEP